ncbi:hypothetical protein DPMN_159402 [Dreissena polymorpha]|uniref:Uncharacterized protein n=1 Tax=Dreissena polymorpha TaxID=45954 RepID=A0A9D4ENB1_DREPO|nr:hypothetical protein DPMN_159402 [Dreissena polymorpha]
MMFASIIFDLSSQAPGKASATVYCYGLSIRFLILEDDLSVLAEDSVITLHLPPNVCKRLLKLLSVMCTALKQLFSGTLKQPCPIMAPVPLSSIKKIGNGRDGPAKQVIKQLNHLPPTM